jgi:hypothetical protein
MSAKSRTLLGLGIALAVSSSAWTASAPDSGTLAALDAWASVCGKVAPATPGAYENYVVAAFGNPPAATLTALRSTSVYRQALVTMRDIYLNETLRKNLRLDCLSTIGQSGVPKG